MPQLSKISNSILLIDKGEILFAGNQVSRGIEAYYELFEGEEKKIFGSGVNLFSIRINGKEAIDKEVECIHGEPIEFEISFELSIEVASFRVGFQFFDKDLKLVSSAFSGVMYLEKGAQQKVGVKIPRSEFSRGKFSIGLLFAEGDGDSNLKLILKRYIGVSSITAVGIAALTPATFQLIGKWYQGSSEN